MCYASMEILGMEEFIPDLDKIKDEDGPPLELPGRKGTGYHYTHIYQHMPSRKVDLKIGRQMLKESAEELASKVENLRKYSKFIEEGNNPPFSVIP